MKKNIRTIVELKEEKRKLQIQKEASKQLFFESLGQTRKSATHFLATKVLLPAGSTSIAAWSLSKLLQNDQGQQNGHPHPIAAQLSNPDSPVYEMIQRLLPLGMKLITAYFGKKEVE